MLKSSDYWTSIKIENIFPDWSNAIGPLLKSLYRLTIYNTYSKSDKDIYKENVLDTGAHVKERFSQ